MDTASFVEGKLAREFEITQLMKDRVTDAEYDRFIQVITRPTAPAA